MRHGAELVLGRGRQACAKTAWNREKSCIITASLRASFRNARAGKWPGGPVTARTTGTSEPMRPATISKNGRPKRLSLVQERQPYPGAFGVVRGEVIELEFYQHAALVGAPVLAERPKITPAAVIGMADRIARGMDRASAALSQMRAGNARQLLKFLGVDIQRDAANRAFTAVSLRHQLHGPHLLSPTIRSC